MGVLSRKAFTENGPEASLDTRCWACNTDWMQQSPRHVGPLVLNMDKYGLDALDRIFDITGLAGPQIGYEAIKLYGNIVGSIGRSENFFAFRWIFGNCGVRNVSVGNPPAAQPRRAVRYLRIGLIVLLGVAMFIIGRVTA